MLGPLTEFNLLHKLLGQDSRFVYGNFNNEERINKHKYKASVILGNNLIRIVGPPSPLQWRRGGEFDCFNLLGFQRKRYIKSFSRLHISFHNCCVLKKVIFILVRTRFIHVIK